MPRSTTPLRCALLAASLGFLATAASAAVPPFEVNMERVKVSTFGGSLASPSKTYFIPTVTLYLSVHGNVWSMAKSGGANSQAHAKFYVKGIDKEYAQGLAQAVQEDLVTRLRAAGYTVLTYDDLKAHPTLSGHARDKPDAKWGLPIQSKDPHKFVVVHPTDDQALDQPINGPVWWMKDIAKEKDLVVLVPEYRFTVPQAYGEKDVGYKRAQASIAMNPATKLAGAMIWTINGKGGSANIQVQEHGMRLVTEVSGTMKQLSQDDTEFSSSWGRTSADYMFTIDRKPFSEGVLRASTQLNSMIVSQIQKAKK